MSYSLFLIGKKNCIKKKLLNQRNEVDKEICTQKKKKKKTYVQELWVIV